KSSATVVVVFSGSTEASSTPIDASVMDASVTSGSISEIAPMRVVLPTPKPPLTTILTAVRVEAAAGARRSELPYKVPDPLDGMDRQCGRLPERDQILCGQVGDQNPAHPQRHAQAGGHLSDRQRSLAAASRWSLPASALAPPLRPPPSRRAAGAGRLSDARSL